MNWVTTILAVLYFLAKELPKFLEIWKKKKLDSKYKTKIEKMEAAIKEYKVSPGAANLKKIEDSQ